MHRSDLKTRFLYFYLKGRKGKAIFMHKINYNRKEMEEEITQPPKLKET